MNDWTEQELVEWWEERAAIYEYDGELPIQDANYRAARDLQRELGGKPLPKSIIERSRRFRTKGRV